MCTKPITYPDGILALCEIREGTAYGKVTEDNLTILIGKLRYADQRVGVTRFWQSAQAGERIDRVLRIPYQRGAEINARHIIKIFDGSGKLYRIKQVQTDPDKQYQDLSLEVIA